MKTIYISSDEFDDVVGLVTERAKLIKGMKADKAKLVKAGASLDMKVQSERMYKARIARVNEQLAALGVGEAA